MLMRPGLRLGPHWEIYTAPRPPSWFSGTHFAAGEVRGKWGGEGREGGKGKGDSVPPLLFFKFNHCYAQQYIVAATYTQSLALALHLVIFISVYHHNAD